MTNRIEIVSMDEAEAIVTLSYMSRGEIELYLKVNNLGLHIDPVTSYMCCIRRNSRHNGLRIFPYINPFKEAYLDDS